MLLAGLVAYVSDVLGRKMGRKRLTILHLRPRTTATLGTVITGMFITVVTIITFAFLNENVYDALFKVEKLKFEISSLQRKAAGLENEKRELEAGVKGLTEVKEYLTKKIQQYKDEREELLSQVDGLRHRLSELEAKLIQREEEYAKLKGTNQTLKNSIDELMDRVRELSEERDRRIVEMQQLKNDIKSKERASLVFRAGAPIVERIVMPKNGHDQALQQTKEILMEVHAMAQKREVEVRDFPEFWRDNKDIFTSLADKLSEEYALSRTSIVVGVISAENIFKGEQLVVEIKWLLNELLFEKGTVLTTFRVDAEKSREAIASMVEYQIDILGEKTYNKGRLSAALDIDPLVIYDAVNAIHKAGSAVDVRVFADESIHVSGPFKIRIEIEPVKETLFIAPIGETVEVEWLPAGTTAEIIEAVGSSLEFSPLTPVSIGHFSAETVSQPENSSLSRESFALTGASESLLRKDGSP